MYVLTDRKSTPMRAARAATSPLEVMRDPGQLALVREERPADVVVGSQPTDWEALLGDDFYRRRGRRLFDLALLLTFGLPALLLGCAIAIGNLIVFRRPSEVFFVQPRVGYRGRVFPMIKFRTMREVAREDEFGSWGSGGDHLRVTSFGRFLRNTHLDELPQLLNVLVGQMAISGPRPEMVEIEEWAAEHIDGFTTRMAVPPGITGYAQVTQGYTGHDVEAYRTKFRVADWYRRQQSFGLDLEILVRTVLWMARGRGWSWKEQARGGAEAEPSADEPQQS